MANFLLVIAYRSFGHVGQKFMHVTPEILEERLVDFAVRVIALANRLSGSFAGKHLANQIVRSGTSPAPNYAESRSAESRADFIHKLRVVVKELNETSVWLRISARSGLVKETLLNGLQTECDELRRIFGASLRTACLRVSK
jgi:four helix bundle protein